MFKLYDFSCLNQDCDNYQKIMEILIADDEKPLCETCQKPMDIALNYGYGKCFMGTPTFHRNSKPK